MNELELILGRKKFKIIAKPNSGKTEIAGFDEEKDALLVNVAAPADKNKANIEIIKFLSKKLGKKVRISSGMTSREKIIEVK